MREDKRRRISKETIEIYCPIAARLGLMAIPASWKTFVLKISIPKILSS